VRKDSSARCLPEENEARTVTNFERYMLVQYSGTVSVLEAPGRAWAQFYQQFISLDSRPRSSEPPSAAPREHKGVSLARFLSASWVMLSDTGSGNTRRSVPYYVLYVLYYITYQYGSYYLLR